MYSLTFLVGVMLWLGLGGDLEVVETGDFSLSSMGGVSGGVGRSSSSSSSSLEAVWRASSMETSVDLLLESSILSKEVLRLTSAALLWAITASTFRGSVLILRGSLLALEDALRSWRLRSTSSVWTVMDLVGGKIGSGTLTLTLAKEAVSIWISLFDEEKWWRFFGVGVWCWSDDEFFLWLWKSRFLCCFDFDDDWGIKTSALILLISCSSFSFTSSNKSLK